MPDSKPSAAYLLPTVLIAAAIALALTLRATEWLSLETVLRRRAEMEQFVHDRQVFAMLAFTAAYAFAVALSLPGATLFTLLGGLMFGGAAGGALSAVAATLGAILLFLAARSAFAAVLRRRAGPWLRKLQAGFEADAASYLLFLRLSPLFPFWLVNLAPAFLGVALPTFAWTTLLGVLPAAFAFAYAGAGLDSALRAQHGQWQACLAAGAQDCRLSLSPGALVTPEMLWALAGLSLLALAPVALRRWHPHKA